MLLERAKSFSLGLKFVTASGGRIDITGATVLMTVYETPRYGSAEVFTWYSLPDGDPVEGQVLFDLQADDLNISPRTYLYSIVMVAASGYSGVIVKGELEIVDNGELNSATLTYPGVNPSQVLEVLLGDNNEVTVSFPSFEYPELVIGNVVTAVTGADAGASIRGRYPVQILDLTLPRGNTGVGLASLAVVAGRLKATLTNGVIMDVGVLPSHPGTGADLLDDLSDVDTVTTPPEITDVLMFDGTQWLPASAIVIDGGVAAYVSPGDIDGGTA